MKKFISCFILFFTLFIANSALAQCDENGCTVTGTPSPKSDLGWWTIGQVPQSSSPYNPKEMAYGMAMAAALKKYADCATNTKINTAGVLNSCIANSSAFGVAASGTCLVGGVLIGGVAGFYASPEVLAAAVATGYRVVGGVVLGAIAGAVAGCQSFGTSVVNYKKDMCAVDQNNSVTKVCGAPPAP